MPRNITGIDELRDYFRGVIARADHHAENISAVVLAIAGGVLWRKDDGNLEVMERDGDMKNVLWFKVNQQRYALSYSHDNKNIEMRRGTTHGDVIALFSNSMTSAQVRDIFSAL